MAPEPIGILSKIIPILLSAVQKPEAERQSGTRDPRRSAVGRFAKDHRASKIQHRLHESLMFSCRSCG